MKKKIILALSLMFCAFLCASFASCESLGEHKAQSGWSYDGEEHWHMCAVEGHTDKLDEGAHVFEDVTSVRTGDGADDIRYYKYCEECGYEVSLEFYSVDTLNVALSVPAGDEASVKNDLSEFMKNVEKQMGKNAFVYREYDASGETNETLSLEKVSFDKVTVDYTGVDFSEVGYKTVTAGYKGLTCEIELLLLPDLTGVENTLYAFEDGENQSIRIYANGYLSIDYATGLKIFAKWEHYDLDNCIISVYGKQEQKFLMIVDDEAVAISSFFAHMLGGEPAVYSIEDRGLTLNVYTKNGKSYCEIFDDDGDNLYYLRTAPVVYPSFNTIVIENLGSYAIDEDDNLTPLEESTSYTGEFYKDGNTYKVEYVSEDKTYYIYLVDFDEENNRTETLTKAVLYAAEKDGMVIYVISFEDKTVKRYSGDIFKSFFLEIGDKV